MTVGAALDEFAARLRLAREALDRGDVPDLPALEPTGDLSGPTTPADLRRFDALMRDLVECQQRLQGLRGQIVRELGELEQRRAAGQAYGTR